MDLIEKVKAAVERDSLIPEGTCVVVGLSGGADSIALLHILHRLGITRLSCISTIAAAARRPPPPSSF